MTNKYLTEENVLPNAYTTPRTTKQLDQAYKLNLELKPVIESGSCKGCFFQNQVEYSVCHVLDCDGDNHVFSKVKNKKDFEKVWVSHYV